jgi:hypothetical protein
VQRSPHASVRRISAMTVVAATQLYRILNTDGFYSYHVQRVYNTSYWKITPPLCSAVDGYKHTWMFFLTFASRMSSVYPLWH